MGDIPGYIFFIGFTITLVMKTNAVPVTEDLGEPAHPSMFRPNGFFLTIAKSVPRIGRRDFPEENLHYPQGIRLARRNDFFLKAAKSVPRIGRRDYTTVERDASVAWPWFRDHEFIPRVLKKDSDVEEYQNKEQEEPRLQAIV